MGSNGGPQHDKPEALARHSSTSSVKVPPVSMPIEIVGVSRRSSGLNLKPPVYGFEAIFNNFPQHRNERPLGAGRRAIHV